MRKSALSLLMVKGDSSRHILPRFDTDGISLRFPVWSVCANSLVTNSKVPNCSRNRTLPPLYGNGHSGEPKPNSQPADQYRSVT